MRFVPTEDALAEAAATWLTEALRDLGAGPAARMRERAGRPRLTLPAGRTPLALYRRLVADPAARRALRMCEFYQLDEYLGAEPDDPVSFHAWLRRVLYDPAGVHPRHVHRLPADAPDPHAACRRFEEELQRSGGLDVAVLGLGRNGHLGFNEPGSAFDSPTRVVPLRPETVRANLAYWNRGGPGYAAAEGAVCKGSDVPSWGLTLGLGVLLAARRILLIAGSDKRDALNALLYGPVDRAFPVSGLRLARDVTVLAVADHPARV